MAVGGIEALELAQLAVTAGNLIALLGIGYKIGKWIGRMEEWQRSQDGRLKRIEHQL